MSDVAITRTEQYLNGIAEGESVDIEPVTRKEFFLAKAAGMDVETPDPVTREEIFLSKISGSSSGGSSGGVPEGWFNDGDTHIWVSMQEGRTSPRLVAYPNGTVTIDWGDGTDPDILTGTSIGVKKETPTHEYAKAGEYVITIKVDGTLLLKGDSGRIFFTLNAGSDNRNDAYCCAVQRVEFGENVQLGEKVLQNGKNVRGVILHESLTSIPSYGLSGCAYLTTIKVPRSVMSINGKGFAYNYGMCCYDFSTHAAIPSLSSADALASIPVDCKIQVPAALYDEWIAATNWATYADNIVAV